MDTNDQSGSNSALGKRHAWKLPLGIAFALIGALLVADLIPTFITIGGPNMHLAADEASAVGTLRTLTELQHQHADAHPANGFSCNMEALKPENSLNKYKFTEAFLASGEHAGYRFLLSDCEPDAKGVVTHYRTTAVPLVFEKTGIRAFCTDQSGAIWFDTSGSLQKCWLAQHRLP
jgi:hypothetical protein